jgi:cysteine desulfurase
MQRPIYLDYQATTPLDPRVLEAMMPYLTHCFGNGGSQHFYGWQVAAAIEKSRQAIATALGTQPENLIFTSGATEANNLALKGVAETYFQRGKHIVTVATEHQAVLAPCRYLASLGFEVTYLPVEPNGLLNIDQFEASLRADTILVSVMGANNEIGVLQPLAALGQLCRHRGIAFHCDGAQTVGKIPLSPEALGIDLLSFTAHKLYGPQGIGALYVRPGSLRLAPQLQGGGQERGLRSGTLSVAPIVGFAKAVELAGAEMATSGDRLGCWRNQLWWGLQKLGDIYLNGDLERRLAGNLNISVGGVQGSSLLLALQPHLALTSGSACSAAQTRPSHVLLALGRSESLARASLRISLGRFTTAGEMEQTLAILEQTITHLRSMVGGKS